MSGLFAVIGRTAVRRRREVLFVWVALLVLGVLFAPRLHEVFEREFVTGNTGDSQAAADVISHEFATGSPFQQQLVFTSATVKVNEPHYRRAAELVIAAASADGLIRSVDSYYSTGDPALLSENGRTTYALLNLRSKTHSDGMNSAGRILDSVAAAPRPPWLRAFVTGEEATHADAISESRTSIQEAERFGLPIAMLVLLLVFGALVAATLPLIVGLIAITLALALAFLVGQFTNLSVYVENFTTMLGLGVGIDYSLFMLTRYRNERREGREVEDAVVEAVTHAGQAIAFSGFAVIAGLGALLVTADPTITSMGIGGILVVLVAVAATLSLLPATIAFLGDRVEAPRALKRPLQALPRLVGGSRGSFWHSWASRVMRRPILLTAVAVAALVALALPAAGLSTGTFGVQVLARDAQSRQGYEILAREFGAGVMSPVDIVIRSRRSDEARTVVGVAALTKRIEGDPRFAGAAAVASGGDATLVRALLPQDPSAKASERAVEALRRDIAPSIAQLRGDTVLVGGATALMMDIDSALYERFPLVIGLILLLTFVLLLVLLRSLLIPLAAAVMNLLSVLAAYGLLVLVFQDGHGEGLLGFESAGSISWITPVLLFGVLFGLSMDYQVFLLSRIRELRDRGHSHSEAVALGLEQTGTVISGAAAIMVVIFAAFAISPLLPLKELGFALAVAILLDATLIRLIVIPAVLHLLGDRSWWLPFAHRGEAGPSQSPEPIQDLADVHPPG